MVGGVGQQRLGIGGGFSPSTSGQGGQQAPSQGQGPLCAASPQLESSVFSDEAQAMQACFQANCTCVNNMSQTTEAFLNDDGSGCGCNTCSTSTV